MATINKKAMMLGAAAMLVLGATAAIASYATKQSLEAPVVIEKTEQPLPAQKSAVKHRAPATNNQQQVAQDCDDGNIVGAVAGGALGGIAGSQLGGGSGKTVATIGGVLGGAYLGKEYINANGVTCRRMG